MAKYLVNILIVPAGGSVVVDAENEEDAQKKAYEELTAGNVVVMPYPGQPGYQIVPLSREITDVEAENINAALKEQTKQAKQSNLILPGNKDKDIILPGDV